MATTGDIADGIAGYLRNMALRPDCDADDFEVLNDTAYLVEAALGALGYLRNARIDLETGCPKATAIRTIDGGIAKLEQAFADAQVLA